MKTLPVVMFTRWILAPARWEHPLGGSIERLGRGLGRSGERITIRRPSAKPGRWSGLIGEMVRDGNTRSDRAAGVAFSAGGTTSGRIKQEFRYDVFRQPAAPGATDYNFGGGEGTRIHRCTASATIGWTSALCGAHGQRRTKRIRRHSGNDEVSRSGGGPQKAITC